MLYIRRNIETDVSRKLDNKRALFIVGARQVGKTTLMKKLIELIGKSRCVFFDLENPEHLKGFSGNVNDTISFISYYANNSEERTYIFIDEIQYLTDFSGTVKYLVDHYSDKYKLIMSGSSTLLIKQSFSESLVGRKDIVELYTLSFNEYCLFKGEEKIADLLENTLPMSYFKVGIPNDTLKRLISDYIIYGAYPQVVLTDNRDEKIELLRDIISSYILKDVKHLFRIEKIDQFNNLIRFLAINIGKELNIRSISNTIGLYWDTVQKHIQALLESYIISVVKPFHRNLNTEIKKMPKVYFIDTGVRNAIINNFNHLDLQVDKGELFENFIYLQLFYNKSLLGSVKFWKTRSGQEIDFILTEENKLSAIEVKYRVFKQNHFAAFQRAYPEAECEMISMS